MTHVVLRVDRLDTPPLDLDAIDPDCVPGPWIKVSSIEPDGIGNACLSHVCTEGADGAEALGRKIQSLVGITGD